MTSPSRPTIVACLANTDLYMTIETNIIRHFIESHLKPHQIAICIHLLRARGQPADGNSLLKTVVKVKGFEPGDGYKWVIARQGSGKTWRPNNSSTIAVPLSTSGQSFDAALREIRSRAWGEFVDSPGGSSDQDGYFLLMIHPRGSSAMLLTWVPNASATCVQEFAAPVRHSELAFWCIMCRESFAHDGRPELPSGVCAFHPGRRLPCVSDSASAEPSSDDGGSTRQMTPEGSSSPASSSHESSSPVRRYIRRLDSDNEWPYRLDPVPPPYAWSCCGGKPGAPGCAAEHLHLLWQPENLVSADQAWRESWDFDGYA